MATMAYENQSNTVGFLGLDEISLDFAASLLRSGYAVQAFEKSGSLIDEFSKIGGKRCGNAVEMNKDLAAIVLLIPQGVNLNKIIVENEAIIKGLHKDAVIILHSTLSYIEIHKLEKILTDDYQLESIVDIFVMRTPNYNLDRELRIVSSGKSETIRKAQPILSAICRKQYSFVGELGAGSKTDTVIKLLEAIHFIAAIEAIALGAQSGVHPLVLYDIISNAAGNSWYFKNCLPELLRGDQIDSNFISTLTQNSVSILDIAKYIVFPLPLLTIAHQQLIAGSSHGKKEDDVVTSFKLWEKMYGVNVADAVKAKTYNPEEKTRQISLESRNVKRIGFIGLGAMGFGMATHLLKSNFSVIAYDVYQPSLSRFEIAGGMIGTSPAEVSKDADVLILMVANEVQAESALYGPNGAVSALPSGASVVVSSTVSPTFIRQLKQRLEDEKKNLTLVDAPVSGGVKRASDGTLTIMAAGTDDALMHACSVLSALSEKLYIIEGGCGAGSGVKMVNQLLAGVHIASAAEAMAFGAHLGLNTRLLFDVITCSSGTSWMFENRAPHMVENDYTPLSAVNIFVKDLGIVSHEGSSLQTPLYISTIAYQLFLAGSAAGWGRLDDAAVVKVYETLTGVKVKAEHPVLSKESVLKSLPSEWPTDPVENIQKLLENNSKTLIVLDDDPTGTQTVHDIEVLTEWDVESLVEQFKKEPRCFFILTNSRALSSEKATKLITTICTNIKTAAKSVKDVDYTVVLRGDSTLRGHFPEEADAAVSVLGEMDSWIICPFFLEGGRYTIGDIHYVADSDRLVPAGDTEFAKDAAFGYKSSNLCEWVEEKTCGRISAFTVATISIDLLRKGGPDAVCKHLCGLQKGSTCIVNAASERDMAVFAAGMIQAEQKGKRFLCRTAASFVSARVGIIKKAPTSPEELGISRQRNGGLIVVGSYVPKTTKQVEELRSQCGYFLESIEIPVERVAMKSLEERECVINQTVEMADALLRRSKDTLIVTSRELIKGENAAASLEINFKVSSALVEIVKRISTRPRYILAKGGITSSDLATKALGARRAKVVGQALAGVPLWLLGPESKHPDVPYIVFPGNVGDANALAQVVTRWARPSRISTTKELLLNAEKGRYAVGAFNVYNLEGAEAVVAAAEHEKSPAILQIHPGAFKHGGVPLVMCCISAAEQANVPITVHFDHGNSKQELMGAIHMGFDSVMVDGSHLSFSDNVSYTKCIAEVAHSKNMLVEAELGRLSGTEDGLTVEDYEALLTDVSQANEFIDTTGIDALAVCIGNVHGKYPPGGPKLKLDLLKKLYDLTSKKGVHLVLHGASGLQKDLVEECIKLGIRKINVNTEVRDAYVDALISSSSKKELIECMTSAKEAMKAVVAEKMRLFGSSGKA